MLLKKTYLDKSNIDGIGLFSGETIKAGEIVWKNSRCSEIEYSENEWKELPIQFKESITKYVYVQNNKYILNLDNSRHLNHSDSPNLDMDENGNNIAVCDIEIGVELTCNYKLFYDTDWLNKTI